MGSSCFRQLSPATPVARRCLSPHHERCLTAPRRFDAAPGPSTTRAPAKSLLSKLSYAASALAVYASQAPSRRGSCRLTQDSLPGGGQPFPGGIGYPQGSSESFRFSLHVTATSTPCVTGRRGMSRRGHGASEVHEGRAEELGSTIRAERDGTGRILSPAWPDPQYLEQLAEGAETSGRRCWSGSR